MPWCVTCWAVSKPSAASHCYSKVTLHLGVIRAYAIKVGDYLQVVVNALDELQKDNPELGSKTSRFKHDLSFEQLLGVLRLAVMNFRKGRLYREADELCRVSLARVDVIVRLTLALQIIMSTSLPVRIFESFEGVHSELSRRRKKKKKAMQLMEDFVAQIRPTMLPDPPNPVPKVSIAGILLLLISRSNSRR